MSYAGAASIRFGDLLPRSLLQCPVALGLNLRAGERRTPASEPVLSRCAHQRSRDGPAGRRRSRSSSDEKRGWSS
jgi:hypothetical protein